MKKNIVITMLFAFVALVMTSCSKDSEGLSRLTYYPVLELAGEEYMVVDKGTTFQDPGFTATLNGEDVSGDVTVNSNVDTNKSGVYTVVYSIKNSDGITANAKRTVVVLDPNSAIEGFYINQATSNRNGTAYGRAFEVLVIDNGDGTISVDDLLGGWYCQRAGYGTNYAMQAIIEVAADGTLTLVDSYVPGWKDGADSLEGTFDAATGTFNFVCVYAGTLTFTETWIKE
ncbi:MAG: DUF5012 domain-containing protein [Prevotella sp.]|nr:DUF5012 domain-containing protein [Prevotella sp.]